MSLFVTQALMKLCQSGGLKSRGPVLVFSDSRVPQTKRLKQSIIYCLTLLKARNPRSRCQQGWLLGGCEGEAVHAFSPASGGLLAIGGTLWLVDASPHLCLHLRMVLFLCVSVQILPFCMDTDHIGLRVHLTPVWLILTQLTTSTGTLLQNKVTV